MKLSCFATCETAQNPFESMSKTSPRLQACHSPPIMTENPGPGSELVQFRPYWSFQSGVPGPQVDVRRWPRFGHAMRLVRAGESRCASLMWGSDIIHCTKTKGLTRKGET